MKNIVHIVLAAWKEGTRQEDLDRLRATARGMATLIPGIVKIDEGPSVSPEGLEDGFHYGLAITFENAAARDGYLPHPDHQVLVEQIVAHCSRVVVFDVAAR